MGASSVVDLIFLNTIITPELPVLDDKVIELKVSTIGAHSVRIIPSPQASKTY